MAGHGVWHGHHHSLRASTSFSSAIIPNVKVKRLRAGFGRFALHKQRWLSTDASRKLKTALFFPGQGVQRVGMAAPWLEAFPEICGPFLEEMDSLLGFSLSKLISEGPGSALMATPNAQPAIMGTSVMIQRVLETKFGFETSKRIDVCLGHSLGEFAAVVAGGHLEFPDALRLLRDRAEMMAKCSADASKASDGAEYGMVAVICEPERLSSLVDAIHEFLGHAISEGGKNDSANEDPSIDEVVIANMNSKNQIVLSGNIERINNLLVQLRQFGGHDPRHVRLATDSPFHSAIMMPAATFMRKTLEQMTVTYPGLFPVISNVSARPFGNAANLRELLARQCVETVRWWDSIRYLDQEQGVRRWIGLGPGKVGRNLVGKEVGMRGADHVRGGGVWGITLPKEIEEVLRGLEETEDASLEVPKS